jgi:hypothetical protein
MIVRTNYCLEQMLGFLTQDQSGAGQSVLYQAKIGLIKAAIAPTPTTQLADLTPADFDGYAMSGAVTWTTTFVDQMGLVTVSAGSKHYQPTGHAIVNTIYGAYLVDNAGTHLLGVEIFLNPIPLPDETYGFDYEMRVSLDPAGRGGAGLVG